MSKRAVWFMLAMVVLLVILAPVTFAQTTGAGF